MCKIASNSASIVPDSEIRQEAARRSSHAYRPFFLAGILFMLLAGAGWGLLLVIKFAIARDYTEFSIHQLNAHGRAMISGFVNLFIIGFAYQAFSGLIAHPIATPRTRLATFVLLIVGIITSIIGQLLWPHRAAWSVTIIGDSIELLAVTAFAIQLVSAFFKGKTTLQPFLGFIFIATGFMVLQSLGALLLNTKTLAAESPMEIVYYVSIYQPPLRNIQFHGTALLMIIGVAHRLLPNFYDIPRASNRTTWLALAICTSSVIVEGVFFIMMRLTENPRFGAAIMLAWIGLLIGVLMIVGRWRVWRTMRDRNGRADRMQKFVRASIIWLGAAWILLVILPLWSRFVANTYFSHAFYGAGRQAFVFGFVSMMIFAFSIKVVPTLNGIVPTRLRSLGDVFWMANIGCALHVMLQVAGDVWPVAFRLLPIAGALEAAAIVSWAAHLWWCMREGKRSSSRSVPEASTRNVKLRIVTG
ncbi:MAG TPA: NnrS family protein [Tepidisphaeraceae bacterium]|nr:NnrS family protein [Tepidisphaeraceae bacterium]